MEPFLGLHQAELIAIFEQDDRDLLKGHTSDVFVGNRMPL